LKENAMKEPVIEKHNGIVINLPYSQAPTHALQSMAAGRGRMSKNFEDDVKFYSQDFRKMYAALLLRERGL
jgi:hypothetical protein